LTSIKLKLLINLCSTCHVSFKETGELEKKWSGFGVIEGLKNTTEGVELCFLFLILFSKIKSVCD
jgi:hypothetical protein